MKFTSSALLFLSLTLVLAACGGESTDQTAGQPSNPYQCERSDATEAAGRCQSDGECACGTHCAYGTCQAECSDSDECDGDQYCDSFGRCRDAADTAPVFSLGPEDVQSLEYSPGQVTLPGSGAAKTVRVVASAGGVDRFVVFASDSTQVSCDGGVNFEEQCSYEDLEADGGVNLAIRQRPGGDVDTQAVEEIGLATRHLEYLVGVDFESETDPRDQPPAGAGIYRGEAVLRRVGLSSRNEADDQEQLQKLKVPVELRLEADGDAFVAEFSDPTGLAFPNGAEPTLATLEPAGDDETLWSLDAPTYLYEGAEEPTGRELQITADWQAPEVTWRGGAVSFVGRTDFGGVTLEDSRPFVEWRVTVTRRGDLTSGLGAVPESFQGIDVAQRAQNPVPAEQNYAPNPRNDSSFDDDTSFVRAGAIACSRRGDANLMRPGFSLAPAEPNTDEDGDEIYAHASDLECTSSGTMKRVPILGTGAWSAGDVLEDCIKELGPDYSPGDAAACVDAERIRAGIALGLEDSRRRALDDERHPPEQGARLATYLMSQWFGVQSFVASQFGQVERMNDVLPDAERVEILTSPVDLLSLLNTSWDVLLHPRYGVAWGLAPLEALAQPDYRVARVADPLPDGPQQQAAPVVIVRAVESQLNLTRQVINYSKFDGDEFQALQPKATQTFRQSLIALAIAGGLAVDAAVLGEPDWFGEWTSGRDSVASNMRQAVESLLDDSNPLGIQDTDLPLYGINEQDSAADRFMAVSHFLLGVGNSGGVARNLVEDADAELESARLAYTNFKTFRYREEMAENGKLRRSENIRRDYGGQIGSLCNPQWNSERVLSFDDKTLDPNSCYIRDETPSGESCGFDEQEMHERLTVGEVLADICVGRAMIDRYGDSVRSRDSSFDDLIENMPRNRIEEVQMQRGQGPGVVELTTDDWQSSSSLVIDLNRLGRLIARGSTSADAEFVRNANQDCRAQYGEDYERPTQSPDSCNFSSDCAVGDRCAQGRCAPEGESPAANPECYRGELGQTALQMRATATDINIASSELREYSDQYDSAMVSCIYGQLGNDMVEQEIENHNSQMELLGGIKLAAQITSHTITGVRDCAESADLSGVLTGSTVGVCAAAAGVAAADSTADGMDFAMEKAEREHELALERIDSMVEELTCFNDAQAHLIGMRSATLRIKRAQQELQQQWVEFQGMKDSVDGLVFEGRDALQREQSRSISPLSMDFWIDGTIRAYDRDFRHARRALYVAMLAVEYELQMTYTGRDNILAARTTDELDQALTELTNITLPGNISGASSPDNAVAVISLKNDVLGVSDHSGFPDGQHQMTADQRLQMVLNRPENARYDDAGDFLGVEIPFTLAPEGQQNESGVPILSGRSCAERLWTINASIHGEDLIRDSDTQIRQLEIRKRNTFYSQWCTANGRDNEVQVASVRPSQNLFLDPRSRDEETDANLPDIVSEEDKFAKGSINSYINITRGELEDEAYSNGATIALAGRGVYGDYALFIPSDALASSSEDSGLVLNNVEDILIRLEYVSSLTN